MRGPNESDKVEYHQLAKVEEGPNESVGNVGVADAWLGGEVPDY